MNYMFSTKYDIRYYLDKEVGTKVTDEIFDIIDKDERECEKERKNLRGKILGRSLIKSFSGKMPRS